jgi:GTP:adenosylcobinamide-phosphate guanylyltransferase
LTRAIVLAGSPNNGRLKDCSSAPNEALIKIGNKFMVEYVVEALLVSQKIEKIIVVGPKLSLERIFQKKIKDLKIVESGETIIQSLLNAMDFIGNDLNSRVLVVTSDIPLITGQIIDNFIEECINEEADIIYPIVSKSVNQAKFPGVKRTYVRLKEGVFTGGNIFLIKPSIIKPCAYYAEELVQLRKSPLKLLKYIGFEYFLKYLFRNLSIKDAELRISQLFNIKGKAISVSHPEIGVDVDKPSDLELVERVLGK